MEAEDDSELHCYLVSICSKIDPLVLASLGNLLGTSDFSSLPTVRGRLKFVYQFLAFYTNFAIYS